MSDVVIETDRLIIRDVALPDGEAFIHMASAGSLNDVGFDKGCGSLMDDWIIDMNSRLKGLYGRNISNEWDYLIQIKIRGDQKVCGVAFGKNRVFIH